MRNFDFAVSVEQISHTNLTLLIWDFLMKNQQQYKYTYDFTYIGQPKTGIEYRLHLYSNSWPERLNIRIVVLLNDKNTNRTIGKRFAVTEHNEEIVETVYNYPQSDICSADYMGYKVLVPCNAYDIIMTGKLFLLYINLHTIEKCLPIEYGPSWNRPIPNWDSIFYPLNRVNQSKFDPGLVPFFSEEMPFLDESPTNNYIIFFVFTILIVILFRCKIWLKRKKEQ